MNTLEQQHKQLNNNSQPTTSASTPTAEAATAADGEEAEDEVMEAPEQLLQMLSLTAGLPTSDSNEHATTANGTSEGQQPPESATAAAAAASQQRNYQQVLQQFGGLLKQVTNSPACNAAVWGMLGRWYGLQGQLLSSQEARLKQVRRS